MTLKKTSIEFESTKLSIYKTIIQLAVTHACKQESLRTRDQSML